MVRTYREQRSTILKPEFEGSNTLADSEVFNREALDRLLAVPGCAGVRIYYGMNEGLQVHAILVAVDEDNTDLVAAASSEPLPAEDPVIVQEAIRCPPTCPPGSGLNP